ncbi:siderophore-interacting protein [Saccharopolyspora flava]|uniref:NADPH-dependent ferric siderophore reductase, contains FAD-binding and SIP domains n=1 Tax=Saccharopolyspora flava TaxID=95161 RepID=A0A1I6SPH5_9PSEU|nr:siderophore-interacting protein [Saccharopolyspora flava]SFS78800.1 NADPH-dependent ferric siderophore reductase, contains FAD-binding and SIP domains [Saccharopolyspora flava]
MTGTQNGQRALVKPRYRLFPVEVARVLRLSPSFVRITFTGACLSGFGFGGHDQRIKIVLPKPGRALDDFPEGEDWYQRWLALPEDVRPDLRTYTVRDYRPESCEVDVDFVLHGLDDGHAGPASTFAAGARPGQVLGLFAPDRPGGGRMWGCEWAPPASADRLVLAGDETAVPALAAVVESLPADARGVVCVEVPEEADRQEWACPAGVRVRWYARTGAPHGKLLGEGVAAALRELCPVDGTGSPGGALEDVDVDTDVLWEVPETSTGSIYGFLAGEASVIKRLRRLLVDEHGIPKRSVAFMGYWREGRC